MNQDRMFPYPAPYDAAGKASALSQSKYFMLLRVEYSLLVVATVFSIDLLDSTGYFASNALVLIAAVTTLLYRSTTKPEESWYKSRALAESIKTSTWRFCMRSAPFEQSAGDRARKEFRNHLKSVLDSNRHIGERLPPDSAADDQINLGMESVRGLDLDQRTKFYEQFRVREQRLWYQMKSVANKVAGKRWVMICVGVYALAIVSVVVRIVYPDWTKWPTEPLIVSASSIVGWIQIKRYTELASAYALTAHEIGIIQGRLTEIKEEHEFSEFVNEAELAFSREHTQWVARSQMM